VAGCPTGIYEKSAEARHGGAPPGSAIPVQGYWFG